MPRRRKCVTGDTDARQGPTREPVCKGTHPPAWARAGNLIEVEFVDGSPRQGIVIEVKQSKAGGWDVPWLTVLFNDGKRELVRSPDVRVISRRRKASRKPRR
jgi:hypothetical protein